MISNNVCIYSQHIPGVSNTIADALSRRFDLNDEDLLLINSSYDLQVQSSYKLYPVHPEICSWMTCWLQKCSAMKESRKTQEIRKIECGDDGLSIQNPLVSQTMRGYQPCSQSTKLTSSALLLPPCEGENFLSQTRKAWSLQPSKRPWQNWVRSLGQTWGTTPHMELDLSPYTPYLPDNSRG